MSGDIGDARGCHAAGLQADGGALGCCCGANVSTMISRPPQHGQATGGTADKGALRCTCYILAFESRMCAGEASNRAFAETGNEKLKIDKADVQRNPWLTDFAKKRGASVIHRQQGHAAN